MRPAPGLPVLALTVQAAETLASGLPALCPLASPVPTNSERAAGIHRHSLPFLSSNLLGSTSRVLGTAHGPQLSDHPFRHPQCPGRPPPPPSHRVATRPLRLTCPFQESSEQVARHPKTQVLLTPLLPDSYL